ncbi:Hypothetical protein LUCI_3803 [Lucifera butyrica]|uniref:histidine kinase n=1 Tax=Lucifera butyrica TaxID=1351585 RepID=A0A498RC08_9FIRM|nr:HAMP domain-containing sensor histidine kinase [Lucifera butyrica]VBB08525.1 Hypothetical protein LUCI_3803 [Lucifera butyrica]
MKTHSIFFRQVISHITVIIFIALTLTGSIIYFVYKGNLMEKEGELNQRVTNIASSFGEELKSGRIPTMREWQLVSNSIGTPMWLEDADGRVLRGQLPPEYNTETMRSDNFWQSVRSQGRLSFVGRGAIAVSVPVLIGERPGIIVAYYTLNSNQYILERLARFYVYPFIVGIIAAIFLGMLLSRKLTRSIGDIANAAVRFSAGDYTSRTSTVGKDEIGALGQTFNAMAESIFHTQQTRREFFANISHELKTPLSCVKVTTEALLDGIAEDEEDQSRYLKRILDETNRMSRLVYDIMDSEQLESGKMRIKQEKIDLAALLMCQADKVEPQLHKKNVRLNLQIYTDKHCVIGDSGRFEQVLDNLMSNAIRYAPKNSLIGLALTKENAYLEVSVSDQGKGIADEELPMIWERFYREDKSRDRSSGGSGLGLSITRGLVEAMGGEITVQSKKGEGTTFKIRIRWVE